MRSKAHKLCKDANENDTEAIMKGIDKLTKKISRGYFSHIEPKVVSGFSKSKTSLMTQKKGKRRPNLTLPEKCKIVHEVTVQYKMVKEVAKKYRVS